jgi:hypothetical protein
MKASWSHLFRKRANQVLSQIYMGIWLRVLGDGHAERALILHHAWKILGVQAL